ncbi:MAG: tetratricopeptide repeat protein [Gammaproteobacteria bacterium]|nr:tetratricopeptide repeat protein [Gammaproteobacteria bacterium]MBU2023138.1 tetratricopeptide repeat protein [Gammaproteobacteria bacterium]MBU2321078.1 tetratricopeptide repeat protein [Gammaproteobacteria bacterium]MBU2414695.1 tetratricopeptide repeat protein [Gammaproteobacteria bacterium]
MSVKKAGSQESLFPSWGALLERSAVTVRDNGDKPTADLIKAFLARNKDDAYLQAATYAQEALGNHEWNTFLKEQLSFTKDQCETSSLALAQSIWRLNCPLIITTNYDKVLDWACPMLADLNHWDIEAAHEQANSLSTKLTQHTVWHLHGRISNANNLILTPDGYTHLYSENKDQQKYAAALATLKTYFTTNRFIFIGFSFDDVVFAGALQSVSKIFDKNTPKHFVLIKENQRERIEKLGLPLIPVNYENHEDLPALLNQLASHAERVNQNEQSEPVGTNTLPTTISPAPNTKPDFDINNPVFNLPFRSKGEGVVGREQVLQELRTQLVSGQQTSIGHAASFNGMGGLGKTQLAVEYAYRYRDKYSNGVMWIAADQDISTQLVIMANNAKWFSPHLETADLLAKAREKLQNSSDCLIIFDNVESKEQIQDYLPNINTAPHLLITSRMNTIGGFTVLPLTLLSDEESVELLLKEANREHLELSDEDQQVCQDIVETLGHLPLAIELAGAYLKRLPSVTLAKYKTLLHSSLDKALTAKDHASFTNHKKGLFGTLTLTEQEIEQSPLIEKVLRLLSWSATASMSTSLMASLLDVSEDDLIEPLALGVELKLLSTTDHTRYAIHRLLKEIQRELHPLDNMQAWGQTVCLLMIGWFETRKDEFSDLKDYQAEIDHLENWQALASKHQWPQAIALIWLQAYPLWHLGKYQQSETLLLTALDLFKQIHTIKHKDNQLLKAHLLADLGTINDHLGKSNQALTYEQTALDIRLTYLDKKHSDVATSYNNIGTTYGEMGLHEKALENKKTALELRLELYGEKHQDVATSYNNIGSTYGDMGLHENALENKKKALELRLELFDENHPDVASSYNNIGTTYGEMGLHEKALENKKKALRILLELFDENHPNVAASYNNIGTTYGKMGLHEKALEYEKTAIELRLELFDENHPNVATSYHNIAATYQALELYPEALTHGRKAFEIRQSLYTSNSTDLLNTMRGIVKTLLAQKQFGRALAELDALKPLANTNKKIKIEILKLQSHIKQTGATSGYRFNNPTKKTNKRKPKRR